MKYTPKQYRNLSSKKKRQLRLGSAGVEASDLHDWKQSQDSKKAFSSVYKRYSGGYR